MFVTLLLQIKEENFNRVRGTHFLVEETLNAKCKEREIEQGAEKESVENFGRQQEL